MINLSDGTVLSSIDLDKDLKSKESSSSLTSINFESKISEIPIEIQENKDFEKLNIQGKGIRNNPYIIENFNITGSFERLIDIRNTDVYFEIKNNRLNSLSKGLYGIFLANVTHATISNNLIKNSKFHGVVVSSSNVITIENNWITNHTNNGIEIHNSFEITLENNIIYENGNFGIWLRDNVQDVKIFDNTLRRNYNYGLSIGYGYLNENPNCYNNEIERNNFLENNYQSNKSQARDHGKSNIFLNNYWSEWRTPDENENNIVDIPYLIDSFISTNNDSFPLVNRAKLPEIFKSQLLYPKGGENLVKSVIVEWSPALDSMGQSINYTLSLSVDNGLTWDNIAENLVKPRYEWDVTTYSENTVGILKIEAKSLTGVKQVSFSTDSFTINKPGWQILVDDLINSFFLQLVIIVSLLLLVMFLGWFQFKKRIIKDMEISEFIYTFKEKQMRKIYHKLIIGIENVKTELLSTSENLSHLLSYDQAVIANIYPPDIQTEMKSSFKGKSVLILIEIAYQPITKSNTSYLAKILKIPQQTTSDEVKKLYDLKYLKPCVSKETLLDTRKKNYSLTEKGLIFLHLLKESLTTTITKMKREEIYEEIEELS